MHDGNDNRSHVHRLLDNFLGWVIMSIINVEVTVQNDCCCKTQSPALNWNIGPVSEQQPIHGLLGANFMLQLTDTQQCKISVVAVDKKGAPAPLQSVSFTSSDANVATVTQDAGDPSSANIVANLPGSCQIAVSAVGSDGGSTLTGSLDLTVVGGAAVSLTVNAGTPAEQS
jgi:hypothetical protein